MFVTIINDCRDDNVVGRQEVRASNLFQSPVSFVGVNSDLEAAGNLVDILDASHGQPNIVLSNVAPRNGQSKKWANGTPFGFFWYYNTLVVTTIDGVMLSLVKKLKVISIVQVVEFQPAVDLLIQENLIAKDRADYLRNTQFRSFEFLPYLAYFLWQRKKAPSQHLLLEEIPSAPRAVWWVDNFGNCKTTLLYSDLVIVNNKVSSNLGELNFYNYLKDVPDNEVALVVGSSGFADKRFVEIVRQGGSAAGSFGITSGFAL